ncbi:Intraflagellar transport protein 80 [Nowakowskiella sp. JEL0407]|nr:Intraflagellar transport protein 80 [Nowakowskiella sp. JEL0407]
MKLKLFTPSSNKHDDIVACVGWIGNNELFSCGDDKKILKWNSDAETLGQLSTSLFDSAKPTMSAANLVSESAKGLVGAVSAQSSIYITNIQWFPIPPGKGQTTAEMFAAAGTDGKFYFCLKNGRVEKAVDAHRGAVLGIKWNYEGSAILSAGEDGSAKIWSRSGMLRTSLIQLGYPIYAIAWSPDNDQILLTNGKNLIIKPLQPSMKSTQVLG